MKKRLLKRLVLVSVVCTLTAWLTACGAGTDVKEEESILPVESLVREPIPEESKNVESSQPVESKTEEPIQPVADETMDEATHAEMMKTYAKVLVDLYTNQIVPDGENGEQVVVDGNIKDNHFAIADVDGDGRDELIIQFATSCMAGMFERVYCYVESSNSVWKEFGEFPSLHYYDNQVITADLSHNQGLSGDFWPYTLYEYNHDHENFEAVAMVDAWDKNYMADDFNGNAFPTDADKDGDGIVYYILIGDSYEYDSPIDGDAYKQWLDGYIGTAKEVTINYQALTKENIDALTK